MIFHHVIQSFYTKEKASHFNHIYIVTGRNTVQQILSQQLIWVTHKIIQAQIHDQNLPTR